MFPRRLHAPLMVGVVVVGVVPLPPPPPQQQQGRQGRVLVALGVVPLWASASRCASGPLLPCGVGRWPWTTVPFAGT